MMKLILLSLFFFVSTHLSAAKISFYDACSSEAVLDVKTDVKEDQSALEVTLSVFSALGVPYVEENGSLKSVNGSPMGYEAYETSKQNPDLKDDEMRVYGLCYEVDGVLPKVYADEYILKTGQENITWFVGYSTYRGGEWSGMCKRAYLIKANYLCENN